MMIKAAMRQAVAEYFTREGAFAA